MSDFELTRCQRCVNYQPYEPDAGLLEGCTAPALYVDEDCQQLIPEVNKKIIGYMQKLGEGCPYFRTEIMDCMRKGMAAFIVKRLEECEKDVSKLL